MTRGRRSVWRSLALVAAVLALAAIGASCGRTGAHGRQAAAPPAAVPALTRSSSPATAAGGTPAPAAASVSSVAAGWWAGAQRLRVDFVSVGQGDALLVTSPVGKTVLIDGGPHAAGEELAAFVRSRTAAPIDLVLLTHRHADHLGGLGAVIERQGARLFMDAPYPHPSPAYAALVRLLERRRIPVREAERGRTVDLGGGARLVLLSPPEPAIAGSRSDVNSNSVVVRLDHGDVHMLLTGDAEAETERWLLASGADVRAQVLKLAHHGSRYASTPGLLRAVSPRVAIASCGAGNEYGHPHAETLDRLARAGVQLFRTDVDGTVTVFSDGRTITVEKQRQRLPANASNDWSGR